MCSKEGESLRQEPGAHTCAFCDIVSCKIERSLVAETEKSVSFISLEGHPLVVPKMHVGENPTTQEEIAFLQDAAALAVYLTPMVREVYGATGVNILLNLGKSAGQEVMHAHFHVIPRVQSDKKIRASLAEPLPREELDRLARILSDQIKIQS